MRAPRSSLRGQESSQEEMTSSQSGVVELGGKRSGGGGVLLCAATLEVPKSPGCMLGVTPVPAFHWDTPSLT